MNDNSSTDIPKIIHYCWFGKKRKSRLIKKCISSWLKYASCYQIIEWNEKTFDINSSPEFVREAYKCKKYAFVSDYVRFYALYKYGGIYFDTDVELIKNLDIKSLSAPFFAMEKEMIINPGLVMGLRPMDNVCIYMMSSYNNTCFHKKGYNLTVCQRIMPFFESKGFNKIDVNQKCGEYYIYDSSYFSPLNPITKNIELTDKTISIHWFNGSWLSKKEKLSKTLIMKWYIRIKNKFIKHNGKD